MMIDAAINRISTLGLVASDASYKRKADFNAGDSLGSYTDSDADHLQYSAFQMPFSFLPVIEGFQWVDTVEGPK